MSRPLRQGQGCTLWHTAYAHGKTLSKYAFFLKNGSRKILKKPLDRTALVGYLLF